MQAAILANAKSIIVVSNSPSGDLEPNDAEKDLKNQIKLAAYLFDIELADYLLINNEDYYSYKKWGAAETYHLCIDSSVLGIEATVDFIEEFVKKKLRL